jgi:hypothetical protein
LAHTVDRPEMVPGAAGGPLTTETARQLAALVPQVFVAVTQTLPAVVPQFTIIDVVPCPETIVAPAGTVHVYEVAPLTAVME